MRISFHGAANLRAFICPALSLRNRFHVLPSSTGLFSGFPPSRKRRARRRAPRYAVPGKAGSRGVLKDKVSALTGTFAGQLRDMLPLGLETSSPRNPVQIVRSMAMPCKIAAQTLLLRRTPQGPGSAFSGSSFRLTPMPWRAQRIMRIRLEMEWMRSSTHSDLRLLSSVFSW